MLLLLWAPLVAHADGFRHMSSLRGRSNLPGFGIFSDTGYRLDLFKGNPSPFLAGAHLEAGLVTQTSPASFHPGLYVQAVPVAPLLLRAQVQRLTFFGLFGALVEFPSVESDWSKRSLRKSRKRAEFGGGWFGEVRAQLRLKVGRILALGEARHVWYAADDVEAGRAWYDPVFDLLVAHHDRLWITKGTVGALLWGDLKSDFLVVAGHWERYATVTSAQTRHLTGAVGLWRPNSTWTGRPAFGLLLGFLPIDPHRAGQPWIGGFANFTFAGGGGVAMP